jgi:lipopolysaccharide export system protein LptA
MKEKMLIVFLVLVLGLTYSAVAQQRAPGPAADTGRIVNILHADRLGFSKKDTANIIQYGAGNVAAQQNNTLFYSDSAVLNQRTKIFQAYGNVHINDADSTHIYGQYMRYHFDTKMAYMQKKVSLTDGKSTLTTEELEYDLNQKIGTYKNGGRLVNGTSVLTSKEGIYYDDLKDIFFRKNVVLVDPKYTLRADSLLYNTQTEIATFIGPTVIIDSAKREIHTSEGFYDMRNRIAQFGKRPVIKDGKSRLTADSIYADDTRGIRRAVGLAVYVDSAEGVSIIAGELTDDRNTNLVMATKKPVMIIKQEDDSIYVAADTILSGFMSRTDSVVLKKQSDTVKKADPKKADTLKKPEPLKKVAVATTNPTDSSNRYMKAFHHVRIFSDSLQAVSDSLFYSAADSVFKLFTNPIVWASGSQITGDTIYLYTKNKKAERLYVFENGLVINKAGPNQYNQIKGTTLNGYFHEGTIDHMRARGNAESIYYVQDEDSAYVGVNRSTADIIDMRFEKRQLNKVVFINDVRGSTTPFRQVNFSEMRLRNFQWLEDRRPKTKAELFAD